MIRELTGLALVLASTWKTRESFWSKYTAKRIARIRARAADPETRRADVLMLLHDYTRNIGPARPSDVTAILGDYAWTVLHDLDSMDLIRVDRWGYITPGKQLATHGSFVMMRVGPQGGDW